MINSSLTFQLIPLISYILPSSIIMALSLLRELINPSELFYIQIAINGSWFLVYIFIIILLVFSGSSTTITAQETSEILSKSLNSATMTIKTEKDLKNFLLLLQYRNLHLQNVIFKVNWKLPVAVGVAKIIYWINDHHFFCRCSPQFRHIW